MGTIAIGMASAEYRFYTAAVPRDQRWDSAPGTPDAMDHTLSRRQWKAAVHEWRKRLRVWYLSQIAHEFLPRDAAERTDQVLDRSFTSAVDAVSARQAAQAAAQAELERRELAALPPRTPQSPRHQLPRAVLTLLMSSVPLSNVWVLPLVAEANGSAPLSRRGEVTARSRDQP